MRLFSPIYSENDKNAKICQKMTQNQAKSIWQFCQGSQKITPRNVIRNP